MVVQLQLLELQTNSVRLAGIYTIICPDCGHTFTMSLSDEGVMDPNNCKNCKAKFIDIRPGTTSNNYVGVVEDGASHDADVLMHQDGLSKDSE